MTESFQHIMKKDTETTFTILELSEDGDDSLWLPVCASFKGITATHLSCKGMITGANANPAEVTEQGAQGRQEHCCGHRLQCDPLCWWGCLGVICAKPVSGFCFNSSTYVFGKKNHRLMSIYLQVVLRALQENCVGTPMSNVFMTEMNKGVI